MINQPPPLPKTKKPWYKKWWVIGLGVLLIAGTLGNLGDSTDPAVDTSGTTTTVAVTTTEAPADITVATTVPATTTTTIPLYEVTVDDFELELDVVESSCYGSAGGLVSGDPILYVSDEAMSATGTLTYEISGLEDGAIEISTMTLLEASYKFQSLSLSIDGCDPSVIVLTPIKYRP